MEPVTVAPVIVAAVQAAPVLLDRDATIGKVVALAEKAAAEAPAWWHSPRRSCPAIRTGCGGPGRGTPTPPRCTPGSCDQAVVAGSAGHRAARRDRPAAADLAVGRRRRARRRRLHHLQLAAALRPGRVARRPGTASSCPPAASGWSGGWATGRRSRSSTPASAGSAGSSAGRTTCRWPGPPLRPGRRRLPGPHLGQLGRLGADPAAHRPGGPDLRDRRHLLHRAADLPADLPGRAALYGGPDDWLSRGNTAIVGPDGEVLAGPLVGEEGILCAEIDRRGPEPAASSSTRSATTAAATCSGWLSIPLRRRPSRSLAGTARPRRDAAGCRQAPARCADDHAPGGRGPGELRADGPRRDHRPRRG